MSSLHHGNNVNPLTITNDSKNAHDVDQSLIIRAFLSGLVSIYKCCTFTVGSDNKKSDYHQCQLLSLLRKNNKVLFFGVPEALCLTNFTIRQCENTMNSRYNELLWVPLKVRYTGSSLYFHM